MIENKIKEVVRDVVDFPKPGIVFKDITPILKNAALCGEITDALVQQIDGLDVDAVVGIESRGFLFGMMLAQALKVPFVPIRKAGKLPAKTIQQACNLEYGSAVLELHEDALLPGQRVVIHDDLLATGGTVVAAAKLVNMLDADVVGFSFIIGLDFLNGKDRLAELHAPVFSLVSY